MSPKSGIGLADWRTLAKGRANRDLGLASPRSLAVLEFLSNDSEDWAAIEGRLDNKWTTVDRVLNTESFRVRLGISIDPKTGVITFENGDETAGRALLMRVLSAMVAPEFEFSFVEAVEDRDKFIEQFVDGAVTGSPEPGSPAPTKNPPLEPPTSKAPPTSAAPECSGGETSDNTVPSPTAAPEALTPSDSARKTLAPPKGARTLPVTGPRLEPLYRECRTLSLKNNENAAALLLRVFIELRSEAYLKKANVAFSNKLQGKNVTSWDDYKITLSEKIDHVARSLDPSGRAQPFAQARLAIDKNTQGLVSIYTLHAYFHNLDMLPDATDLKATWDGWESYLRELHNALAKP